ncbi:hypothetical protein SK128_014891 [Halocaridina rubra]|uniref:Chitin-binding type-2 domain-containing protein n=1 Tax=Halocaridina rubra TaxID=373956 RepID=A0AAN8ZW76_HALRR
MVSTSPRKMLVVSVFSVVAVATTVVLGAPQKGYDYTPQNGIFNPTAQSSQLYDEVLVLEPHETENQFLQGSADEASLVFSDNQNDNDIIDDEHHHSGDHDHDHHHDHHLGLEWLRDAVPGEPGIDYPIYWEVPQTSFNCREVPAAGYYADIEARCQVFHVCNELGDRTFLCPNGTVFNQEHFTCQWWFNVDCGISPEFYALNRNIGVIPGENRDAITHSEEQSQHREEVLPPVPFEPEQFLVAVEEQESVQQRNINRNTGELFSSDYAPAHEASLPLATEEQEIPEHDISQLANENHHQSEGTIPTIQEVPVQQANTLVINVPETIETEVNHSLLETKNTETETESILVPYNTDFAPLEEDVGGVYIQGNEQIFFEETSDANIVDTDTDGVTHHNESSLLDQNSDSELRPNGQGTSDFSDKQSIDHISVHEERVFDADQNNNFISTSQNTETAPTQHDLFEKEDQNVLIQKELNNNFEIQEDNDYTPVLEIEYTTLLPEYFFNQQEIDQSQEPSFVSVHQSTDFATHQQGDYMPVQQEGEHIITHHEEEYTPVQNENVPIQQDVHNLSQQGGEYTPIQQEGEYTPLQPETEYTYVQHEDGPAPSQAGGEYTPVNHERTYATTQQEGEHIPIQQGEEYIPIQPNTNYITVQHGEYSPSHQGDEYSPVQQETEFTPAQQEGESTYIQQEGIYSPVQQDSEHTAVQQENDYIPIQQEADNSVIQQENEYTTFQPEIEYTPISQEGSYAHIQQENEYIPIKQEDEKVTIQHSNEYPPAHEEDEYTPLQQGYEHIPIHQEGEYTPIQQGGEYTPSQQDDTFTQQESEYTPIKQETEHILVQQNEYTSTQQEGVYIPVQEENQDTAFQPETESTPIQQETEYTHIQQDNEFVPISQEGEHFPIHLEGDYIEQGGEYVPLQQDNEFVPISQEGEHFPIHLEGDYIEQGGEYVPLQQDNEFVPISQEGEHFPIHLEGDYIEQGGEYVPLQQDNEFVPISQEGENTPIHLEGDYIEQGGEYVPVQQGGEYSPVQQTGEYIPVQDTSILIQEEDSNSFFHQNSENTPIQQEDKYVPTVDELPVQQEYDYTPQAPEHISLHQETIFESPEEKIIVFPNEEELTLLIPSQEAVDERNYFRPHGLSPVSPEVDTAGLAESLFDVAPEAELNHEEPSITIPEISLFYGVPVYHKPSNIPEVEAERVLAEEIDSKPEVIVPGVLVSDSEIQREDVQSSLNSESETHTLDGNEFFRHANTEISNESGDQVYVDSIHHTINKEQVYDGVSATLEFEDTVSGIELPAEQSIDNLVPINPEVIELEEGYATTVGPTEMKAETNSPYLERETYDEVGDVDLLFRTSFQNLPTDDGSFSVTDTETDLPFFPTETPNFNYAEDDVETEGPQIRGIDALNPYYPTLPTTHEEETETEQPHLFITEIPADIEENIATDFPLYSPIADKHNITSNETSSAIQNENIDDSANVITAAPSSNTNSNNQDPVLSLIFRGSVISTEDDETTTTIPEDESDFDTTIIPRYESDNFFLIQSNGQEQYKDTEATAAPEINEYVTFSPSVHDEENVLEPHFSINGENFEARTSQNQIVFPLQEKTDQEIDSKFAFHVPQHSYTSQQDSHVIPSHNLEAYGPPTDVHIPPPSHSYLPPRAYY